MRRTTKFPRQGPGAPEHQNFVRVIHRVFLTGSYNV